MTYSYFKGDNARSKARDGEYIKSTAKLFVR